MTHLTPDPIGKRRVGWALAAGGMLLVSTDSYFVRLGQAPGATMAFLMAVGSTLTLGIAAVISARSGAELRQRILLHPTALIVVALLSAATQLAFIVAVTRSSVSNVVVIVAGAPLMAAIAGALVLNERPRKPVQFAVALTTIGIAAVMSGSLGTPRLDGDLLAVGAIVCFALSIIGWRRYPTLDRPITLAAGSMVMAIGTAPLVDWSALDARAIIAGGIMGLVANPAGRMLYSSAPRYAPAAEVAVFAPVETVAATVWAWMAFAEVPTGRTIVGGLIVIASVVIATRGAPTLSRSASRG
jgi:drug/metabolite transporter (DMT)-like permease